MPIEPSFVVEQRGVGKPDYTSKVSSALERRGLRLAYSETLKVFGLVYTDEASPYSWVTSPLAAGGTAHLIDNETGLASPFTVPKGYILSILEASHSSDEDVEVWGYVDGFLYMGMGIVSEGQSIYENRVIGFTTVVLDPTGATSHTIDVTVKNLGTESLKGGFSIIALLKAIGTSPLPTTKTVRCKFCGCEETVPRETSRWICPQCGQLNIFVNLTKFTGTP